MKIAHQKMELAVPDWTPFTNAQLAKIENAGPLNMGAFEGKLPDQDQAWAAHVAQTKGLRIWVFFSRPGEDIPEAEETERHKAALRLLFEKCYFTELGAADGDHGKWVIVAKTPAATTQKRTTAVSYLAQQIGYGMALVPIFGNIAKPYADELGLDLRALVEELGFDQ